MKKKSNEQKIINIIFPKELREASPEGLALCEIIINFLIKYKSIEIFCKIHADLGFVECNVIEMKNALTLFLKTKKLELFYKEFTQLLHKKNDKIEVNNSGKLKLIQNNVMSNVFLKEEKGFPNFEWKFLSWF